MSHDPDRTALAGGLCFVGFAIVASVYAFGRDGCAAYAGEPADDQAVTRALTGDELAETGGDEP